MTLEQYAEHYTKLMLEFAQTLGPDTAMGQACLLRAEYVMDFVKAYRGSKKNETPAT